MRVCVCVSILDECFVDFEMPKENRDSFATMCLSYRCYKYERKKENTEKIWLLFIIAAFHDVVKILVAARHAMREY